MQQCDNRIGLKRLFDYQRFQHNHRLQALIEEVESRYCKALSDDDLSFVNAAGEADAFRSADEAKRRKENPK